jgi:hypothetical protein
MNNTIIHIGMPRTATTFFQKNIFPNLKGYEYHGLADTTFSNAFNQLQFADDSFYDKKIVEDLVSEWKGKNIIISNEGFIGQSYNLNYINRTIIANRLSELFPDAKILLVLRNQIDLIASLYAISLLWRETKDIDDYIWSPNSKKVDYGPINLDYNTYDDYENLVGYDYLSLIKLYKQKFPHVEIVLFEDFINEPTLFAKQLDTFFGVEPNTIHNLIKNNEPINEGVNIKQAKKLIKLNRYRFLTFSKLFHRIYLRRKRSIMNANQAADKPYFSDEKIIELKAHFGPLNKRLVQEYPKINLQKYSKEYYL